MPSCSRARVPACRLCAPVVRPSPSSACSYLVLTLFLPCSYLVLTRVRTLVLFWWGRLWPYPSLTHYGHAYGRPSSSSSSSSDDAARPVAPSSLALWVCWVLAHGEGADPCTARAPDPCTAPYSSTRPSHPIHCSTAPAALCPPWCWAPRSAPVVTRAAVHPGPCRPFRLPTCPARPLSTACAPLPGGERGGGPGVSPGTMRTRGL